MTAVDETAEVVDSIEAGSPNGEPGSDALFDVQAAEKPEEKTEPKAEEPKKETPEPEVAPKAPPKADIEPPTDAEPEADDPPTFTFHPKDGSPDIIVASVKVALPEGKQRWFFWKLRKLQGLEQPIFWLDQAGIPDHLQERIMLLSDEEWARFYEEWMADGSGASPGE